MSKIQIKCDMCGENCNPQELKTIKFDPTYPNALWLSEADLYGEHFICHNCLHKVGWSEEKETETTSNKGE